MVGRFATDAPQAALLHAEKRLHENVAGQPRWKDCREPTAVRFGVNRFTRMTTGLSFGWQRMQLQQTQSSFVKTDLFGRGPNFG